MCQALLLDYRSSSEQQQQEQIKLYPVLHSTWEDKVKRYKGKLYKGQDIIITVRK